MGAMTAECQYSGAVNARLARSRLAAWLVAAAAAATLGVIAATPLRVEARVICATWTICLAIHAIDSLRRVRRIALGRDGGIEVEIDGRWRAGVVRDGSFVAPFLTIVRWRPAGARFDRSIVIVPDMIAREEFRALRVLLRWR